MLAVVLAVFAHAQLCSTTLEQGPYVPVAAHDSMAIWARFSGRSNVRLQYSYDGVVWDNTPYRTTSPVNANTMFWIIPSNGADRLQYSVVIEGCEPSLVRQTAYAPAPDSVEPFTFAVTADAFKTNQQADPPWYSINNAHPAFVLQIGDYDHGNPGENGNLDISAWREMDRGVLGSKPVGRALDRNIFANGIPFFHTWDDHDYCYNNADATCPGKDSARRAFDEFYLRPNAPVPATIAYSFHWGALAEFFVLDTRTYRTETSMLGADQDKWLAESVATSSAPMKVILSSSVWNPNAKQLDAWANYPDEQLGLATFWNDRHVTGIVVITGDMHSVGLIDDGTHGFYPNVSVPPINLDGKGCTGGPCGEWTVPWTDVHPHAGYGWFEISQDDEGTHMLLSNRSNKGQLRNQYSFTVPYSTR